MMGKMFSLRVNLWRKKLILRAVIQLITQGQEDKRTHYENGLLCMESQRPLLAAFRVAWVFRKPHLNSGECWHILSFSSASCRPQVHTWLVHFLPLWILSGSVTPSRAWLKARFPAEICLWLVLFLSGKHWQSAGGFEGFCTSSNLVFYHQLTLGSSNPREDKEGEWRAALDPDKFVIVDSQVSAVRGLWRMTGWSVLKTLMISCFLSEYGAT